MQQINKEVDRAHHRGEAAADARAQGDVASLDPLGSEDTVVHAHRAVAVEAEGPQARGAVIPAGAMNSVYHEAVRENTIRDTCGAVSYTHLTLPTKRIV